ncbi:nucleotide exchange factor GrpE [Patescibacteria group bacterium]|nr:nucleotide exchange factor GrpE [Patescibacteria group bacterium]
MNKPKQADHDLDLVKQIETLQAELLLAKEKERRAVADYQNLVRRSGEERIRIAKLAALDFIEVLLDPLSHLSLASDQLNDQGLKMVVDQLWRKLNEVGLEEINPVGQLFDVNTMEAVLDPSKESADEQNPTKKDEKNQTHKVSKVVAKGYKLNGEVVRHAKVIVE